jgi:small subunit ribosomal protein S9
MEAEKKTIGKNKFIYAKGARKTAVAQVRLYKKGKGDLQINDLDYTNYFRTENLRKIFLDALRVAGHLKDVDITIKAHAGGLMSQAQACRHAISRALTLLDPALRPLLKAEGFLTRDPRVKERKKPGLKRARRAPQWAKR